MTRREKRANAFANRSHEDILAERHKADAIDPGDPFGRPHDVGSVDGLLGAGKEVFRLLPKMEDIPGEFKTFHDVSPWSKLQTEWFFNGLPKNALGKPKPGIDRRKALCHLAAIQRSFEPSHEHKSAGVAYLMSRWFNL